MRLTYCDLDKLTIDFRFWQLFKAARVASFVPYDESHVLADPT